MMILAESQLPSAESQLMSQQELRSPLCLSGSFGLPNYLSFGLPYA